MDVETRLTKQAAPIRFRGSGSLVLELGRNDREPYQPSTWVDPHLGHAGLNGRGIQRVHAGEWRRPRLRKRRNQGRRRLTIDERHGVSREIGRESAVPASPIEEGSVGSEPVRVVGGPPEPHALKDLPRALAKDLRRLLEIDEVGDVRARRQEDGEAERRGESEKEPARLRRLEPTLLSRGGDHLGRRRLPRRQRRRQRIASRQRRRHLRRRGRPLSGILLHAPQDCPLDGGLHSRDQRRRTRRRILRVLAPIVRDAARVERPLARVELVEDEAQRVQVASDRRSPARELLGRHVGGRPADLRLGSDLPRRHGETEVHDPSPAAPVHHHVGGLQVPVQDSAIVRRGESRTELPRELQRLVLREPADPAKQRREVFAVHVLHREESGGRPPRRCRRRGTRWDGRRTCAVRTSEKNRSSSARSDESRSGRNFRATGCPSFRSSAR